ncbi:MAG TPA: hypothetical protein VMW27_17455 [Thermoanaerobaculia bacterium]|nr:hypothetical protein [Thermoanaerobaculia bacterium]
MTGASKGAVTRGGRARALSVLLGVLAASPLAAATSTLPTPTITFTTTGQQTVTLEVCNVQGCTQVTKTVTVLNPMPAITSALAGTTAEVGQLVRLAGAGTGKPPLVYRWRVMQGLTQVAEVTGGTAYWNTAGFAPGVYTIFLTLQNGVGSVQSVALPVTLLPEQGANFFTITPCRIYDSRDFADPLRSNVPRQIAATLLTCGIPITAKAVAANVTVVVPTGDGHASLYPGNYPVPNSTTINFRAGVVRANFAVVPLATDGSGTLSVNAFVSNNGSTHLIVDIAGYFQNPPVF